VNQRMLLVAALALMAGGLLLGGIGLVVGGGATPVQSRQSFFGPNGPNRQQGPAGGLRPGRPGGRENEQGEGPEKPFPGPAATPKPKVSPTP
jgi:hypothetical protein